MFILQDMWGDDVYVGDTVIASRPAGAGTTQLDYCEVGKIHAKSVTLIRLNRDGSHAEPKYQWENVKFTLQKAYGSSDQCGKIVKYHA